MLKKYKLGRLASTTLGTNRKAFAHKTTKIVGRPQVTLSVMRTIAQCYEDYSTQLPDKKRVSKKTGLPTKILDRPIDQVWKQFMERNPDLRVCRSLFYRSRPSHIKSPTQAKYRGCLCDYCQNINLKLQIMNQHLQEKGKSEKKITDHRHVAALTVCVKENGRRYHNAKCIQRQCTNCGVQLLNHYLGDLDSTILTSWQQTKELHCKGGKSYTTLKKALVEKNGTVGELITELLNEAAPHPQHLLNADWQNQQFSQLKSRLPEKHVLSVLDFAENYSTFYQDEVQSSYWSHNQVTIHPIVCYYRCVNCDALMTESLIFVSDDTTHDYHAVNHFVTVAYEHLRTARNFDIVKSLRFSDGCAAQYKSRGPIADIAHSHQDNGFQTQHNYFGSRHGKGPSDGESAVVKSMASTAVKSTTTIIATAWDMYIFLHEHATKDGGCTTHFRRSVFFVPGVEVARNRPREIKTITGTRKLHSVESTCDVNKIRSESLSCFCKPCLDAAGPCENQDYVEPWEEIKLTCIKTNTTGESLFN